MAKKQKMTDDELVAKVNAEVSLCNTQSESYLSDQRINSNYSFSNQQTTFTAPTTGMSGIKFFFTPSVVNTLVMYNAKIFCGNKDTVEMMARSTDQNVQMAAQQLSAAVNNVIHRQNNGFDIITELLRSAAVNKNGIVKVLWSEKPVAYEEELSGVTEQSVLQYIAEKEGMGYEVEVTATTEVTEAVYEAVADPLTGESVEVMTTESSGDYTLRLERMEGGIEVSVLPPEEFLINEDTTSINNDDLTRFVAHRREMFLTDAMMMFPDADESDFGAGDITFYQQEKAARHAVDGTYTQYGDEGGSDGMTQKVEIIESWVRADRNGDNFAEWRHVFTSGSNLLLDEEWYGPLPFSSYTFFPIPHKFYGQSVYDKLKSYEEAATGLMRSELDFARRQNTPQFIVKNTDNTEAIRRFVQSGKPGVMPGGTTFSPDNIYQIQTAGGAGKAQANLAELRQQVIADIGIDPITGQISTDIEKSGNDAAKTSMVIDNASVKIEGYARRFADGPLRDINWLIVMEMIRHKDDPYVSQIIEGVTPGVPFIAGHLGLERVVSKTDIVARVGLGHQTGHQKIQATQAIQPMLQMLKENPDPATYHLLRESLIGFGYENPESILGELDFWQQQAAEMKQMEQQQMQLQMQQLQMQQQQVEVDISIKQQEFELRRQLEMAKAMSEVEKNGASAEKMLAEARKVLKEVDIADQLPPANINVTL